MLDVASTSQAIGEFLDWLPTTGRHVAETLTEIEVRCPQRYCEAGTNSRNGDPCVKCDGTGWVMSELTEPRLVPASGTIQTWLAEYYRIDLNLVEAEKRAILEHLRAKM